MMKSPTLKIPVQLLALLFLLLVAVGCSSTVPVDGFEDRGDGTDLRFDLPGTGNSVGSWEDGGGEAPSTTVSPLAEGTRVRILAFIRAVGGGQPDLSADIPVGQGVYVAGSGGSLTAEGTGLRLLSGKTYDFYAFTPDLSPSGPGYTLSVDHGVDFASSLTTAMVTEERRVKLNPLVRRSSKVTVVAAPQADNVTGFTVRSLKLKNMTKGPLSVSPSSDFDLSGVLQTGEMTLAGEKFSSLSDPQSPLAQSASAVILPKTAAKFGIELTVNFDNQTSDTRLTAEVGGEAGQEFKAGYHYRLNMKLQGGHAELWLTVVPWDSDVTTVPELGIGTRLDLKIQSWEEVVINGSNPDDPGYIG